MPSSFFSSHRLRRSGFNSRPSSLCQERSSRFTPQDVRYELEQLGQLSPDPPRPTVRMPPRNPIPHSSSRQGAHQHLATLSPVRDPAPYTGFGIGSHKVDQMLQNLNEAVQVNNSHRDMTRTVLHDPLARVPSQRSGSDQTTSTIKATAPAFTPLSMMNQPRTSHDPFRSQRTHPETDGQTPQSGTSSDPFWSQQAHPGTVMQTSQAGTCGSSTHLYHTHPGTVMHTPQGGRLDDYTHPQQTHPATVMQQPQPGRFDDSTNPYQARSGNFMQTPQGRAAGDFTHPHPHHTHPEPIGQTSQAGIIGDSTYSYQTQPGTFMQTSRAGIVSDYSQLQQTHAESMMQEPYGGTLRDYAHSPRMQTPQRGTLGEFARSQQTSPGRVMHTPRSGRSIGHFLSQQTYRGTALQTSQAGTLSASPRSHQTNPGTVMQTSQTETIGGSTYLQRTHLPGSVTDPTQSGQSHQAGIVTIPIESQSLHQPLPTTESTQQSHQSATVADPDLHTHQSMKGDTTIPHPTLHTHQSMQGDTSISNLPLHTHQSMKGDVTTPNPPLQTHQLMKGETPADTSLHTHQTMKGDTIITSSTDVAGIPSTDETITEPHHTESTHHHNRQPGPAEFSQADKNKTSPRGDILNSVESGRLLPPPTPISYTAMGRPVPHGGFADFNTPYGGDHFGTPKDFHPGKNFSTMQGNAVIHEIAREVPKRKEGDLQSGVEWFHSAQRFGDIDSVEKVLNCQNPSTSSHTLFKGNLLPKPIGHERASASKTASGSTTSTITPKKDLMKVPSAQDAAGLMAGALANMLRYVDGSVVRDCFARWARPAEWAIDKSRDGNKSFFGGGFEAAPQRVARDPRYQHSVTADGRATYFEVPGKGRRQWGFRE